MFTNREYKKIIGNRREILKSKNDEIQVVYCICDWINYFTGIMKKNDFVKNNSLFINPRLETHPCLLTNEFIEYMMMRQEG